jgi:hypothetical protein
VIDRFAHIFCIDRNTIFRIEKHNQATRYNPDTVLLTLPVQVPAE